MDETDLEMLSSAVESLLGQESFRKTVIHLEAELARSTQAFVWAAVDLGALPCELPRVIRSCWIFGLRKDMPSGRHYHPNSIQHMVFVRGHGTANIGGTKRPIVLFTSPGASLTDKWIIIGQGVPHEFIPEGENMIVVSFHTCPASELEEIDCETGATRFYEGRGA